MWAWYVYCICIDVSTYILQWTMNNNNEQNQFTSLYLIDFWFRNLIKYFAANRWNWSNLSQWFCIQPQSVKQLTVEWCNTNTNTYEKQPSSTCDLYEGSHLRSLLLKVQAVLLQISNLSSLCFQSSLRFGMFKLDSQHLTAKYETHFSEGLCCHTLFMSKVHPWMKRDFDSRIALDSFGNVIHVGSISRRKLIKTC